MGPIPSLTLAALAAFCLAWFWIGWSLARRRRDRFWHRELRRQEKAWIAALQSRDAAWRGQVERNDRAWARAFARIPKPMRRYTLACVFGGRGPRTGP